MSVESVTIGFDCGLCETKSGFGVAGSCDLVNEKCICPEGYSGNDDWVPTETCHVNEQVAFVIHVLQFINCILVMLATVACHLVLVRRWNLTFLGFSKNAEKRKALKPFAMGQFSFNASGRRKSRKARIKQITLIANLFFFMFALTSTFYQAPYLFKNTDGDKWTISDGHPWHPTILALACSGLMAAVYLMLISWYVTLPNVEAYGGLFKLNPFFVKYPNFIVKFSYCMCVVAFILPEVFIIILPSIDKEYLPLQVKGFDAITFIWALLFGTFEFLVATSVITSFKQGIITLDRPFVNSPETSKRRQRELKILRKAIQTTKAFRGINTLFLFSSFALSILWFAIKQNHQYLVFGAIAQGIYITVLFIPIAVIWRTNGGLVPFLDSDSLQGTDRNMLATGTRGSHDGSISKTQLNSNPDASDANRDV